MNRRSHETAHAMPRGTRGTHGPFSWPGALVICAISTHGVFRRVQNLWGLSGVFSRLDWCFLPVRKTLLSPAIAPQSQKKNPSTKQRRRVRKRKSAGCLASLLSTSRACCQLWIGPSTANAYTLRSPIIAAGQQPKRNSRRKKTLWLTPWDGTWSAEFGGSNTRAGKSQTRTRFLIGTSSVGSEIAMPATSKAGFAAGGRITRAIGVFTALRSPQAIRHAVRGISHCTPPSAISRRRSLLVAGGDLFPGRSLSRRAICTTSARRCPGSSFGGLVSTGVRPVAELALIKVSRGFCLGLGSVPLLHGFEITSRPSGSVAIEGKTHTEPVTYSFCPVHNYGFDPQLLDMQAQTFGWVEIPCPHTGPHTKPVEVVSAPGWWAYGFAAYLIIFWCLLITWQRRHALEAPKKQQT